MARVTLMDVARHCGVSRATVSLVLNDSPLVAAKTRDRVRQAMTELGYVYNRAAASLRTQHSDAIGVVLTNITNPYFAEFAAGLQDTLTSSGTVPLLAVSGEDRDTAASPGQIAGRTQRGRHRAGACPRHDARATFRICSARLWCCWPAACTAWMSTTSARKTATAGMRPPSICTATAAVESPLSVASPTPRLARSAPAAWRNS